MSARVAFLYHDRATSAAVPASQLIRSDLSDNSPNQRFLDYNELNYRPSPGREEAGDAMGEGFINVDGLGNVEELVERQAQ